MKRSNDAKVTASREYAILLFARHGLIRLDLCSWRAATGKVGQINGLPNSRGILRATNGVDCFIERGDGSIYIGPDLAHWQNDRQEKDMPHRAAQNTNKRTNKNSQASSPRRSRVLELYT